MSHPAEVKPLAPDQAARILVIDDEPLNVDVIERILRDAGYEHITSVTDPRQAVRGCMETVPDLIMLDLHMPHMDGYTVLRQLRAQAPAGVFLPILVLTADWSPEARHRALASGASDFLTRPLDTSEIVLRVGNLLSTRALQAQLCRQNRDLETAVDERTAELRAAHERLRAEMKGRIEAQEALRRHTDFVHLLEVITVAASQSAPVHQTMQVAVDQICESTGWAVGHALKRSTSGALVSAGLWYLRDPASSLPFRQASEGMSFASGIGLPGRVLASAQPAWIVDLATDINFRRSEIAAQTGLRGGFALPLLIGNEVAAVLEFFSTGTIPPEPEMLDAMHHIGAQLGRVLERQRAEEALRSSEAKFRSFAQLASDGIVLADALGHIISWNRGAQQIFGYAEEEVIGRSLLTLLPARLRSEFPGGEAWLAHPDLQRMLGRMVEVEGCRKDGSKFPMELALDVWTTWDGTFCSGVVREITERKRMEDSLRQGEDRLRRLLEATKVIPWTLDFETLTVTYIGPQIMALLGFGLEVWHRPGFWMERLHPDDRDWTLRHCEEALGRQGSLELEYRLLAADGRVVWIHSLVSAGGQGSRTLSGFLLDVTAQKQAQETLRQYAAVFEFSHDAIMGSTLDGTLTSWNRGAERLSGYAQGEVLGRSAGLLFPEGEAAEFPRLLASLARGEHVEALDAVLLRKDGSVLDICLTLSPIRDAHGRVSGVCGIVRDISERKRAEEALRRSHDRLEGLVTERTAELQETNGRLRSEITERRAIEVDLRQSEDRLKTLITSVEEIVFEFDENGTYANFWAGDTELIAQINKEFAGRSFAEVFGESVGRTFQETVRRVVATGRPETVEHTLNLAGGRRWFLSRLAALNDPHGERRTVCLLARDITHRKAAEEELRLAKDDAERANSAKTNFLSRMSHELRTPLNAILGFAQLLDRERLSPEDQEGLDQIQTAGQHLLGLINEVLDMARIEVGRLTLSLEPVSCAEAVAESQALVRPLAAGRGIVIEEMTGDWMIMADRQRLRQVLLNFLSNAIKYNRTGGNVTVSCAPQECCLRISVTDSGKGIPTEKLEHLFKPFERLETHPASVEGIGLGLAISKRLIELMGGSIGVESRPGEGSTFWLTLPLARSDAGRVAPAAPEDPAAPLSALPPCYILYIEDNLSNLKLVERILERQPGIHLLAATHGQPGLELAVRHLPALILLDLHLPDLPGAEVLARLRADPRTAGIPVIVTSADPGANRLAHLRNGAIQGFVSKPISVESFTRTLNNVLGQNPPGARSTPPLPAPASPPSMPDVPAEISPTA